MTLKFFAHRFLDIILVMTVLGLFGCTQSPQARNAKFLASGKKLLEKKDTARAILQFQNAAHAMPRGPEAYYQLGNAYLQAGDWASAVANLRKALELNPKHEAARLLIAQMMTYTDQPAILKEAQERLQGLLQDTPEDPAALQALALTELKLGSTDSAIQHLDRAMARAPQEVMIAAVLAQAKLQQGDAKGAEEVLKKVCEKLPKSGSALVILGRFYLSQNRVADAEQEFRKALQMESNNADALFNLASLQLQTGRKQEAESGFARLSTLPDKTYRPVHALFLFQAGRRDEAVREFEKLFWETPDDRMARTRLVAAYQTVDRTADARKILADALKRNPKDMDALVQEGELLIAVGNYADAEADLNKVLKVQHDSAELHYIRAQLYRARGQTLTYRQDLAEALRLNPYLLAARLEFARALEATEPRTAVMLLNEAPPSQRDTLAVIVERNWALWASGNLPDMRKGIDQGLSRYKTLELLTQDGLWKLRSGNPSAARAALQGALKLNPADLRALSGLRQSYAVEKQDAIAVQKVREYATQEPQAAPVQEFLGFLLMTQKDRPGARAAFTAAKAADPRYTAADFALAELDVADHKLPDAIARIQAVLTAYGEDVTARLWLGKLQDRAGNHPEALKQFRMVVNDDAGNAEGLNNLAYLLAEYGNDTNEALKYAQRAQEIAPDNPEFADTLGWILYRKQLYSPAVTQLARAASHNGNAVWKYHLAMAYMRTGDLRRGRETLDAALKMDPSLPEAKTAKQLAGANQ